MFRVKIHKSDLNWMSGPGDFKPSMKCRLKTQFFIDCEINSKEINHIRLIPVKSNNKQELLRPEIKRLNLSVYFTYI